jgi:hypothetical protein
MSSKQAAENFPWIHKKHGEKMEEKKNKEVATAFNQKC